jgi:hypothetical protein
MSLHKLSSNSPRTQNLYLKTIRKPVKLLGIKKNDKNLDFEQHVVIICKKASLKLHAFARVAPYMEANKLPMPMKAFIE